MKSKFEVRKKKPNFKRTDSNKYKFNSKWRKPRGLHNKIRLNRAGHGSSPSVGYGMPKEIRGLHRSGLEIVLVSNLRDVVGLDPKKHGLVLKATLGARSKVKLLEKVKEFRIFNLKDVDKFLNDVKIKLEKKKKESMSKKQKRSKAKEEAEKKKAEKEKKEADDKTKEEGKDKVETKEDKQKKFVKQVEGDRR